MKNESKKKMKNLVKKNMTYILVVAWITPIIIIAVVIYCQRERVAKIQAAKDLSKNIEIANKAIEDGDCLLVEKHLGIAENCAIER